MDLIQECIETGHYLDTRHALERQTQRQINRMEILYVLKKGFHEKRKDKIDHFYQNWNYAIRGKTLDRKNLRIIVSFDSNTKMLIITAIELT